MSLMNFMKIFTNYNSTHAIVALIIYLSIALYISFHNTLALQPNKFHINFKMNITYLKSILLFFMEVLYSFFFRILNLNC